MLPHGGVWQVLPAAGGMGRSVTLAMGSLLTSLPWDQQPDVTLVAII